MGNETSGNGKISVKLKGKRSKKDADVHKTIEKHVNREFVEPANTGEVGGKERLTECRKKMKAFDLKSKNIRNFVHHEDIKKVPLVPITAAKCMSELLKEAKAAKNAKALERNESQSRKVRTFYTCYEQPYVT